MGLSTPSASLLMSLSRVMQLTQQKEACHLKGSRQVLKMGLCESNDIQQGQVQDWGNPRYLYRLVEEVIKSSPVEKDFGV